MPSKSSGSDPSSSTPKADSSTDAPSKPMKLLFSDVWSDLFDVLRPEVSDSLKTAAEKKLTQYLQQAAEAHAITANYNVLILFDEGRMIKSDADRIYTAVTSFKEKKPILLILFSDGGHIASAYLIGKLCREYSCGNFVIAVPRRAKSAATLLCCAADKIHMGSLSELGPIDPQIDNMPALGLKSAIEHIADLVKQHPLAADMFARYLHLSVQPIHLGHYERVAESAAQYAQRLLSGRSKSTGDIKQLAFDLVYSYKDHGFVIDKNEAVTLFGSEVIATNTPEYDFANALYQDLVLINRAAEIMEHSFYFIGSLASNPIFTSKRKAS